MPLSPYEHAAASYAVSIEAVKFSRERLVPQLHGILAPNPRERAAILLFLRMHSWAESMALFDHAKHYQVSAVGARSLFELLVDLLLLAADKDGKDVDRYLRFPEIEKYRVARQRVSFRQRHAEFDIVDPAPLRAFVEAPGKEAEVKAIRLQLWGPDRNGKPQTKTHWSGLEMPGRVSRLGPKYESYYNELYSQLSWYVHSGSVGTSDRSAEDFDNVLGLAHWYAGAFFLEAMATVGKQLRIADADPNFFKDLNLIRELPGVVLTQARSRNEAATHDDVTPRGAGDGPKTSG